MFAEGNRVEYRHADGVVEWWKNDRGGLEQGFTVPSSVAAEGSVRISMKVAGMGVGCDPNQPGDLVFSEDSEAPVLGYRDLKAWDAEGDLLAATMQPAGEGFEISVATAGAAFPITIDPVVVNLQGILTAQPSGVVGTGETFGEATAISGDLAVAGAPYDEDNAGYRGAVYVFRWRDQAWHFEDRLRAPLKKNTPFAPMGFSVAISGGQIFASSQQRNDGTTVIPGFIQTFSYARGKWKAAQQVTSPDPAPGFEFATDFAVSGDTLVVVDFGPNNSGRLWFFQRKGAKWVSGQSLEVAGAISRVAIDGDVAALSKGSVVDIIERGADGWAQSISVEPVTNTFLSNLVVAGGKVLFGTPFAYNQDVRCGAAFLYTRVNGTWTPLRIDPPDTTTWQTFGMRVAMAGDKLVIGNEDSLHPYTLAPEPVAGPVITKPDAYYRYALAFNCSEKHLIVRGYLEGTPFRSGTGLSAYEFTGGAWVPRGPVSPGYNGEGSISGSLAISGEKAFVGAPSDSSPDGIGTGSVYVFRRAKSGWQREAKLTAPVPRAFAAFGEALAAVPGRLVIGTKEEDPAESHQTLAHVYANSGTQWSHETTLEFPDAEVEVASQRLIATRGNYVLIGLPNLLDAGKYGRALLFSKSGGTWSLEKHFQPNPAVGDMFFGQAIALNEASADSSDVIWISSRTSSGARVYRFEKSGPGWVAGPTIVPPPDTDTNYFASTLAYSGGSLMVGTPIFFGGGSVDIYDTASGTGPVRLAPASEDVVNFGQHIAISGDIAAIFCQAGEPRHPRIHWAQRSGNSWTLSNHLDLTGSVSTIALHGDTLMTVDPEGRTEAYPGETVQQGYARFFRISEPLPEIAIFNGKKQAAKGSTLKIPASNVTLSLDIRNLGKSRLVDLEVLLEGADAESFIVSQPGLASLAPATATTFNVRVDPNATAGPKSAKLVILSNDADENPYVIHLQYSPRR